MYFAKAGNVRGKFFLRKWHSIEKKNFFCTILYFFHGLCLDTKFILDIFPQEVKKYLGSASKKQGQSGNGKQTIFFFLALGLDINSYHCYDCTYLDNQQDLSSNTSTKFHLNLTNSNRNVSRKDRQTQTHRDKVWRSHIYPDCDDKILLDRYLFRLEISKSL